MKAKRNEKVYIKEREEKELLKLLAEGKTQVEIARIIHLAPSTISYKIKQIDESKVKQAKQKAIQKAKKREEKELLGLLTEGKTQTEMVRIMGITRETLINKIEKIETSKVEQAKQKAKEREEELLLELLAEGKTLSAISQIKHLTPAAILQKISKIETSKVEQAKQKGKKARQEEEKREEEELLELLSQGKTQTQIAEQKEMSLTTISRKLAEINSDKVEQAKQEGEKVKEKTKQNEINEKGKQYLELLSQGKTQYQIAKEIKRSFATVSRDIAKIEASKVEQARQKGKEARKKLKTEITVLIQKLSSNTITSEELKNLYTIEIKKLNIRQLFIIVKILIERSKYTEAINFLNAIANRNDIEPRDKDKCIQMENTIKEIKREQKQRNNKQKKEKSEEEK